MIGSFYRRPSSNLNEFLNELENIFDLIRNENKNIYLLGDFNINLFNFDTDLQVKRFVNLMHGNNMLNVINKATRVTSTSATLIDHIWTNNFHNTHINGILFEKTTDHFPVFSFFKNNFQKGDKNKSKPIEIEYRDFNDNNILSFRLDLQEVDWSLVNVNNSNVAYDNFLLIFNNLFDKHFPIKTREIKLDKKIYITNEIKKTIRDKNRLQKLAAKWPISYGPLYKDKRNEVTKLIRISKNQHYKDKLLECAGDSRSTWRIINEIMNKDNFKDSNSTYNWDLNNDKFDAINTVNSFNNHFSSVGSKLASKIVQNNIDPIDYL